MTNSESLSYKGKFGFLINLLIKIFHRKNLCNICHRDTAQLDIKKQVYDVEVEFMIFIPWNVISLMKLPRGC